MSQIFDSIRDGAACMVEPAWMRAQRALAGRSVRAFGSVQIDRSKDVSDWRDPGW